jgi:HIP---CoA ligase
MDRTDEGTRGDLRWGTIPGLLRDAAATHGAAEALVDRSAEPAVRMDWTELLGRVDAMARALIGAGVQPGDRVAIWAPNCWEWVVALLGLQSAGAALVPLNTRYKGREAAQILARSRARLLFTVEGFLGNDYVSMLAEAGARPPDLERVVLLRDTGTVPDGTVSLADFLAGGADVDAAAVDGRVAALDGSAMSDLLFTSGTTGHPKGVVQTHGQTLRAFADWADLVGLRSDDRYLIINPFFHAFGYKAGILACLMTGATMVPQAVFDVDAALDTISAERISMIPGPPTLYQTLINHPGFDRERAGSLRLAVTGAAVVPVELVRQMRTVLGFETVLTAYGLTECCGVVTVCRRDDDAETVATTSGRAIPGVEVRIVDDGGVEQPAGAAGEVVVRGYNVMGAYFEEPEQTAEAIDADGWLHTGDVGVMDERGYLRITDRTKDMFIVGGFNAYPAEIEQLLLAHPHVAQAAVVGVPDDRQGEVGFAYVVPTAGAAPDPAEVVAWARGTMANFKAPRYVEVVDALPLNASGKVLKYELRERAIRELL